MSKMSELNIDIVNMLEDRIHPTRIAKILGIPLSMIYDVLENWDDIKGNTEVFSPFETINS